MSRTTRTTTRPAARRVAAGTLAAAALSLGVAMPAQAHVSVTPSTTAAGAYSVLTFSVAHGCEASPTTSLTFAMPESVVTVSPTVNPNWTVEKKMQKLTTPVDDGHGGEYTERVAQVVYTARTPLPDGYRDTVELQLQLPEAEGEKFVVPVVQKCEQGETRWTQTYAEGQPEPESPAPFLTITAAEDSEHGHGAAAGDSTDGAPASEQDNHAEGGDHTSSSAPGWIGLVLGALGLAAGGAALARTRKQS